MARVCFLEEVEEGTVMREEFFAQSASLVAQLPDGASFRRVEAREDDQCFGNRVALYEAPRVRVRIVKDRDEIRIELSAPQRDDWLMLDELCEILGSPAPGLDFSSNAEALLRNYHGIVSALEESALPNTEMALEDLRRKKRAAVLARLGAGK